MSFDVRRVTPDEFEKVVRVDAVTFNYAVTDHVLAQARTFLEPDRQFLLADGDDIVGCSSNLTLELTVPGGATVPMTGVTWVGVLPTHHRRGGLTKMMDNLVRDGIEHGEPVAGLYASESSIYRRFGYGTASRMATTRIEVRRAQLRSPHQLVGKIKLVELNEVTPILTPIHDTLRRTRNGMLSRPENVIAAEYMRETPPPPFNQNSRVRAAVHYDQSGNADGLIRYDPGHEESWLPNVDVDVFELWGLTPEVELDLWMYALGMDFAGAVVGRHRPVDDPIIDLLADPRRWQLTPRDGLYLRIANINTFLSARRYLSEGEVVIEVVQPDGTSSRHKIAGGPHGAECTTTTDAPLVTFDLAALGMISLGDTSLERLWRAGLVEEHKPRAALRVAAMFLWPQLPWSGYVF